MQRVTILETRGTRLRLDVSAIDMVARQEWHNLLPSHCLPFGEPGKGLNRGLLALGQSRCIWQCRGRWRLSLGARVTSGRRRWRRFLGVGFGKALPEAPPAEGPEASASGRSPPRGIFSGGGRGKGSAQALNQRPPPRRRAPQPSPPEARRSDGHREERKQLDHVLENSPVSSRRKPSTGRTENGRAPSPSPSLSLPHPSGRAAEETRSCLEIRRSTASRRRASGLPSHNLLSQVPHS